MQFVARSRFLRYSPFKLRPIADFVRGKNAQYVLSWLQANENQRTIPLKKAIASAVANAKNLRDMAPHDLTIKELRVDQGPMFRYFKAGAMGRAVILRKRFSHISVILEPKIESKEV